MAGKSGKAEQKAARTARLSAALRENLKRRKAQARGRAENVTSEEVGAPAPSPPPSPDFRRNRGSE